MVSKAYSVVDQCTNVVFEVRNRPFAETRMVPRWKRLVKRFLDVIVAFAGLLLLLPLIIYIVIRIKLDSKGPIFYYQERIGYNGIPFIIFKFRSMYRDSEKDGPALSSANDKRVTSWGSKIRKWKLDELPQLLNVLLGDMSLVGPRPERKYYIDKVSEIYPYFNYLHQVKPGLTSLGMITYGYAHNIEEIIQRMKNDLTYLESYTLFLDLKVLYFTFRSIISGNIYSNTVKLNKRLPMVKISTLN